MDDGRDNETDADQDESQEKVTAIEEENDTSLRLSLIIFLNRFWKYY